MQRPERVRDPVVLLDETRCDACLARDDAQQVAELRVIVDKAHAAVSCIAASTTACVVRVP